MSKKTLLTILFITITIGFIIIAIVNTVIGQSQSYEYSLVNTTNDKILEDTLDKSYNMEGSININNQNNNYNQNNNRNYEINTETELNETEKSNNISEIRNTESTVSRSSEIERNVESTASVKYVDTLSEKILEKEENIYGVKVSTYNNITYDLYSNGYKDIITSIQSTEIDNSQYNGNTSDLLNEAYRNIDIYSEKVNEVLNFTNQYRNEVGLKNLTLDNGLCAAASVRALEMAYTENLSHTRPDGAKCFVVLKDLNIDYNYAGENIGDGFVLSENVCKAWKQSSSHYKNIVSTKYNKIGIGVAQSLNRKYYWVQIFSN